MVKSTSEAEMSFESIEIVTGVIQLNPSPLK